nr:hypothetical protein [Tanacetum cinerariifolium]
MSRDVITVGSTMQIPLLYRGEYSQLHERFMNYLEEQTDGEAMINSIQHGDLPLPVIAQVSLAGNVQNAHPTLKDPIFWIVEEKKTRKIDREQLLDTYLRYLQVINYLKNYGYKKDNCELNYKFLNNLQLEWKQYGDVNDALGYKKKSVVVTSDPLALVVEKIKVRKQKKKVVVSLDSEGSCADDFSELKKITALLAKAFNRRNFYSKPTNNNMRTSSTSQSANKKQEFVKSNDKKVEKKDVSLRRVVPRNYNPKGERFLIASRFPTPPIAYAFFSPGATVTDCSCSKGSVEDKILVPKLPENYARCAKCGHPVNGHYCQGCALVREKLEEDLVTYSQNFQNISESSDDSTNVVNAPREPIVVKTDHGVNPPHIDKCCYECGEALDGIYCQQCICKSCGKGAHTGYNCPPKVPIISNPEPCNQTMNNELPQTLPSFDPTCYSEKEKSVPCVSKPNFVDESFKIFNPPPQPPVYSCEFCGSNAQYGHYCTPQAPFNNPKPSYSQDLNFL